MEGVHGGVIVIAGREAVAPSPRAGLDRRLLAGF
jgi:hypothetical protein